MNHKHGTSQYRLNYAKSHAALLVENTQRIEMMWQLSDQKLVDEEIAENYIKALIDETIRNFEYYKSYIEYREDMK